ncbi:hypothetical protein ACHAXA_009653 [Cyclostephanos tholiformis]|uniref:Uncharacterized protein n=1 Tax=Cyclostephanos tholiformis TaxID=382380 RepID=A0ABD3R527_9STRA
MVDIISAGANSTNNNNNNVVVEPEIILKKKPRAKYGTIFTGDPNRVKLDGYYNSTGGNVDYLPDYECTGGSTIPSHRRCPHVLPPPHEDVNNSSMGLPTSGGWDGRLLHVNMPSYRDPLCPRTLLNLFTKSARPNDIRVRVLQQNVPEEDDHCLEKYCEMMMMMIERGRGKEEGGGGGGTIDSGGDARDAAAVVGKGGAEGEDDYECPHRDQIYIHEIHARDAAGPTYARGLIGQDMLRAYQHGEISPQDFCMSTDSHMDFEPDWDDKMVQMWDMAENEYGILSTYVANIDQLGTNLNDRHEVPHLCMVIFTSQVRTHATKCAYELSRPKLTNAIWGAGLSFSKCHAELKVPVDPHTPGIFDGEEFNRASRFWTYGYDIYTPHRVYVLHDYPGSQHNPKTSSWGTGKFSQEDTRYSHYRLYTMLDIPGGEVDVEKANRMKRSKYGLGDRRSLDQLIQFSGIDLRHRKNTIDGVDRCGNLQWVPFVEHPRGVNYIPKFDDLDESPLDLPYDPTSVWYDPNDGGDGNIVVIVDDKEDKKGKEGEDSDVMEKEMKLMRAVHDAHRNEAMKLAGDASVLAHHEALAAALVEDRGVGASVPKKGEDSASSLYSDRREVISNAAKAAMLGDRISRGHLRVFPPRLAVVSGGKEEVVDVNEGYSPPTLGGGIPRGRFSFLPMNNRGSSSHGGGEAEGGVGEGGLRRHGVEHLPVQVKLVVFAMVLGLCVAIVSSGGDRRKRRAESNKTG